MSIVDVLSDMPQTVGLTEQLTSLYIYIFIYSDRVDERYTVQLPAQRTEIVQVSTVFQ